MYEYIPYYLRGIIENEFWFVLGMSMPKIEDEISISNYYNAAGIRIILIRIGIMNDKRYNT